MPADHQKRPWVGGGKGRGWDELQPVGTWRTYGDHAVATKSFATGWAGATNNAMISVLQNIAGDRRKVESCKARVIQHCFRGYITKIRHIQFKRKVITLQRWYLHCAQRFLRCRRQKNFQKRWDAGNIIFRFFKYLHDRSIAAIVRSAMIARRNTAALIVQSRVRVLFVRRLVERWHHAASSISIWFARATRQAVRSKCMSKHAKRHESASKIQQFFRNSVNRFLAAAARKKMILMKMCEQREYKAARIIQKKARTFMRQCQASAAFVQKLTLTLQHIKSAEAFEQSKILKRRMKQLKSERKTLLQNAKDASLAMTKAKKRIEEAKKKGDKEALESAKAELVESKLQYEHARNEVKNIDKELAQTEEQLATLSSYISPMSSPLKPPDNESSGEDSEADTSFLAIIEDAERNYGAAVMQQLWRNYFARKCVRSMRINRVVTKLQTWWRAVSYNGKFKRHLMVSVRLRIFEAKEAEIEGKRAYEEYWQCFWDKIATSLQRIYRYYRDDKRRRYLRDKERSRLALEGRELRRHRKRMIDRAKRLREARALQVIAATIIQSWWRMILAKGVLLKIIWERELYATVLQTSWRRKIAYRILAGKQRAYQLTKNQKLAFVEERTPYGAAELAHKRMLEYYDPAIHGRGPVIKVVKHVRAMYEAAATFFPLLFDHHVKEVRETYRRKRKAKLKPRDEIPDGDPSVMAHEFKVGDRVKVRWRDRKWSYPAMIIGVHFSNFISQITGNKRGFDYQCFDVVYDEDHLLERHVPFEWITAFVTRPKEIPKREPGSRGFDPTDTRLTEVFIAKQNERRLAHALVPKAISLAEIEETNICSKRSHERVQLAIHRTQQNTLGSRRGVIGFQILLGNQATWTFRTKQQRKIQRLKERYKQHFKPSDHVLWYECAPNRDLRVQVRRSTNDKLPVNIWVKKGPAVRHMVEVKMGGGWANNTLALRRLQKDGWKGWKSNAVKPSELPPPHAKPTHRRAMRIDEMPKIHWSRLPYTLWGKFDAVKRPITDIKISTVDYGQQNPFREEETLFDQGYLKMPIDMVHHGMDPGTFLWVKWGENKREKEEKVVDKIAGLHVASLKGSATVEHMLKNAELEATNVAQYRRDVEEMPLSHQRLWRMVDQLALEDHELHQLHEAYKAIDMYNNGYLDWDNLLHYVGFDHGDMPIFFDYLLAFFPIEDDYGRSLARARNRTDPFRFGDFVRFVGVYCMLDTSRFEEFCFFYADTSGEGLCDLSEMNKLIEALQLSDDPKSPFVVKRMQGKMRQYFKTLSKVDPPERINLNLKQFKACSRRFPRMSLPLHKLQYFISRSIMGEEFWNEKKWAFMKARKMMRRVFRKEQIKKAQESASIDGSDLTLEENGSQSTTSLKSGLATSSILVKSMEMSGGTSRMV